MKRTIDWGDFSMHEAGVNYLKDLLAEHNIDVAAAGPAYEDGDLHPSKVDRYPDLWVPAWNEWIEVKTTRYAEYLGNVESGVWGHYPDGTLLVHMVVRDDQIRERGWYRKSEAAIAGENTNPYGETYVEPRPRGRDWSNDLNGLRPIHTLFRDALHPDRKAAEYRPLKEELKSWD